MKVFVIVVTYNGAKWIEKCFGSLVASTIPLQILAIDNASSDNTVSQIKDQFPEVEIVETGFNLGFGKANNIGMKKALDENADFVFLLNQDAWVESNTIEIMISKSSRHTEFGILSSLHFKNKNELEYYFSTLISPDQSPGLLSDLVTRYFKKEVYEINFVHAAFWLITSECLNRVGFFDPVFPHYGEDNDYCERVKYFGFKIGVVPIVKVTHDIGDRKIQDSNSEYFRNIEILIYLKNLNNPFPKSYRTLIKGKRKEMLRSLIWMQFKNYLEKCKELKFLKNNYLDIAQNRKISLINGRF